MSGKTPSATDLLNKIEMSLAKAGPAIFTNWGDIPTVFPCKPLISKVTYFVWSYFIEI